MKKVRAIFYDPYAPKKTSVIRAAFFNVDKLSKEMGELLDTNDIECVGNNWFDLYFDRLGFYRQEYYLEKYGRIIMTDFPLGMIVGPAIITGPKLTNVRPDAAFSVVKHLDSSYSRKKISIPPERLLAVQ